jgi:hypothetical protein
MTFADLVVNWFSTVNSCDIAAVVVTFLGDNSGNTHTVFVELSDRDCEKGIVVITLMWQTSCGRQWTVDSGPIMGKGEREKNVSQR